MTLISYFTMECKCSNYRSEKLSIDPKLAKVSIWDQQINFVLIVDSLRTLSFYPNGKLNMCDHLRRHCFSI